LWRINNPAAEGVQIAYQRQQSRVLQPSFGRLGLQKRSSIGFHPAGKPVENGFIESLNE
jgi:hypothetical protein